MTNSNNEKPDALTPLQKAAVAYKKVRNELDAVLSEPIAIIGMACRLPGNVNTPEDYWQLLINNQSGIIDIPSTRWDIDTYYDADKDSPGKMYVRKGGFLQTPIDEFDAELFHISPREAEDMDPQQRMALEVAFEAIEQAGIKPSDLMRTATGVYMGICFNDYGHLITESQQADAVDNYYSTGNHYSVLSGRISYYFGLQGPSISMDTACSSSLVTLDAAVKDLRLKRCNLALAGGVNLMLAPEPTISFCKSGMLSPEGQCNTFDASADGYVRGEGCGILVLKRLSDALADNDTILALIRGTAVNQDGPSSGLTVPNGLAQEQVIKAALANAKITPNDVSYVEAHGTGTSLGDPIELEALKNSYTKERDQDKPLRVGSVKTNIGHTEAVAGVASVMKVVLALMHEKIPATLHFKTLNPSVDLSNTPLEIASKNTDWPRGDKRMAGISSFGFSGTNAHVILEEGPTLSEAQTTQLQHRIENKQHFERQPYWAKAAMPVLGQHNEFIHPLLGAQYTLPNQEQLYRGALHLGALAYLRDHQVYGHVIYPGAGYLEMMLAAGFYGLSEGPIHLSQVSIEAALSVDALKSIETQVLMKPTDAGYEVSIYSGEKNNWQPHAHGMVTSLEQGHKLQPLHVADIKARCVTQLSTTEFYEQANAIGLQYGPQFQALTQIFIGENEAFGELQCPSTSIGYLAHPSLIDGALQLSLVGQSKGLFLPIGCDEMTFYAPLPERLFTHWQETEQSDSGRAGNLTFCTETGEILATITGMHYRKTNEQALKHMLVHETGINDLLYEWTWQNKVLEETALDGPLGHWLILSDGLVSKTLLALLVEQGVTYQVVSKAEHPKTKEAFVSLLTSAHFTRVVHASSPSIQVSFDTAQVLGTQSVLHLAQALVQSEEAITVPLVLITQSSSTDNLAQSPIDGLYKTIRLEHPELDMKHIDLGSEWDASELLNILLKSSGEEIYRLNNHTCQVPRLSRAKTQETAESSSLIRPGATYLVTGGLGGLGLTLARWLAQQGAGHVVLSGRRTLDEHSIKSITDLNTPQTRITYEVMDVGEEDSVAHLLQGLQEAEKPLKGIFHLAGVLDDATLMEQDWAHFETVFRPKCHGSWYLHQYSNTLDLFVMFSSVASTLGSPGQSNYAAANAFMDALCAYRQQQGLPGLSISWGPWSEVGMAKDLVSRHAKSGLLGLSPQEGMRVLQMALLSPQSHLTVAKINWKNYLNQFTEAPSWLEAFAVEQVSRHDLLAQLELLPVTARFDAVKSYVAQVLKAVVGLQESAFVDEKKGFFDMGLDSLMAVELKNRLQQGLGKAVRLDSTLVFDYSNVASMTQHLAELLKIDSIKPKKQALAPIAVRIDDPIAIVGIGCRYPGGANNPEAFWQVLEEGIDGICEVPKARFDVNEYYDPAYDVPGKMYTRNGGFLTVPVDLFDADFFGISPKEAQDMDPQQRLLLEVTWEALEQAGIPQSDLAGSMTGLFVGMMYSDYSQLILTSEGTKGMGTYYGSGNAFSAAVGRVSYALGLQGPCLAIDTACSSSLVAINSACESLRLGQCQQAIAGGVSLMLAPGSFISACQAHMLSPDGHCKTFDASADGYARAEGCGIIVLKRLSDAQRDGDTIYALVKSSGVNQGGASGGLTVPNGKAQEALLRQVYSEVGLKADDIDYVEAHGTGTSLGDPIEIRAIGGAYGDRDPNHPLWIGSAKSNIGHAESAAGVAGVIKLVLALNHEALPGNLHFNTLNPKIELNFPATIVTQTTPWPHGARVRRGGVSSFGFSGTNAHVIIEESPQVAIKATSIEERPLHILTLSAKTPAALDALIDAYQVQLNQSKAELADVCFTANTGRNHERYRMAVIAKDIDELKEKLGRGDFIKAEVQNTQDYDVAELLKTQDWDKGLQDLAVAYTHGAVIDWKEWDAAYARRKISLPTYPFQRQRYWAEAANIVVGRKLESVHSLLGESYSTPDNDIVYRGELHLGALGYLRDHQVYGHVIYPGAGYLEMMLAAGFYAIGEGIIHLSNMSIEAALSFDASKPIETQVIMKPIEAGYEVAIYSGEKGRWQCHARGTIRINEQSRIIQPLDIASIKSRCEKQLSQAEFYNYVNSTGIHYGPHFQALSHIDVGQNEALGELNYASVSKDYLTHPSLLDGAFQLLASMPLNGLFLPIGCDAVEFYTPFPGHLFAHWQETEQSETGKTGNLIFCTETGEILARITGMHYRKTTEQALKQMLSHETNIHDLMYEWTWQEAVLERDIEDLGHCLVFSDGEDSGAIIQYLTQQGASCKLISKAAHPKTKEEFSTLLQSEQFSRVLHLSSLGASASIEEAQVLGTESVLHLVQALVAMNAKVPLTLITSEDLAQSPLDGFYKTLIAEHPELKITRIDLEEGWAPELVAQAITSKSDEQWFRLKDDSIFVPRFLKARDAQIKRQELTRPANDQFRLQSKQKGLLDDLILAPLELKMHLDPHEVEVEVRAVGLNFRDVLDALGLYPGDPGPMGGDGAGVVKRVGFEVKHLKAGDEVFGMMSGALSRLAWVHEDNITNKPSTLNFAQAAALPTVFLTVHYAFTRCTVLKASDTVLIHAGAGGVGQAAIQMAKLIGAKIITTAGSEEKRAVLKAQGVEHIFDSRHLTFGKDIEALTQGKGVDVVLNSLSGEGFIETSLCICSPNARFLEIGKRDIWTKEQMNAHRPDIDYHIIALDDISQTSPELIQEMLLELLPLFEQNKLQPLPIEIFPIEKAIQAFEYMQTAKHIGKIIIEQPIVPGIEDKIHANATYLITGGLGGLGLTLAQWLSKHGAGHIVLTGRRALDKETDVPFAYESLDIGDEKAVKSLITRLNKSDKPLKGIFHLAGVLDDATLIEQDWAHFETVFKPKVYGSYYLHKHAKDLDLFVVFSSVASSLGSPGQSNYAAANAFMDALSKQRRHQGLPALSISWGPWSDVGMAKDLVARHAKGGLLGIKPADGMRALEAALLLNQPHLTVANMNWPNYLKSMIEAPTWLGTFAQNKMSKENLIAQLESVAPEKRMPLVKQYVIDIVRAVIGLSASQALDEQKGFFDMGLDSLMAIELKNRLQAGIGKTAIIGTTSVFDHSSVNDMVNYLGQLLQIIELPTGKTLKNKNTEIDEQIRNLDASLDELDYDELLKMLGKGDE